MSKSKEKTIINKVKEGIKETSRVLGIHPSEVTKAQFFNVVEDISEWQLRTVGGITAVKNAHFPLDSKDLAAINEQKEAAKYIRELERKLGDKEFLKKQALDGIKKAVTEIKWPKTKLPKVKKNRKKKNMTMELMVSDVHFGKLSPGFNLKVARERVNELKEVFLEEYAREATNFNVEKIILAFVGDMIESYTMHGLESAKGCEFGNAEQIKSAIEVLAIELVEPIAKLGLPVVIPCVAGNHDRVEKERTMNKPGKHYMSWVIYHSIKMIMEAKGYKNVKFIIPENSNCIVSLYGNNILYEHGDNLNGIDRRHLNKLMNDRSTQYGMVIHMMRSGHWHEYLCSGRGKFIINESLCGQDGYAETRGYDSHAGQTINFYIETKARPTCFYRSFPVYLGGK
jgi:UDP-2,3-diacylglucosamine pyrophosphatase LpxH